MKSAGEVLDISAAYDLVGSYHAAAQLAGCSPNTVKRVILARDAGQPAHVRKQAARVTDPFLPLLEQWAWESRGKIRADVIHAKLVATGEYGGSYRSTSRAVQGVKTAYRLGHARVHRPWVCEPGRWVQYDFGDGPVVDGRKTTLFVAWLAWSRYRVVYALPDRKAGTVYAALDRLFRELGGVPTYVLTDNEKMVTTSHVASVPVRNANAVEFGRQYGTTILTCAPADPALKGGVEAAVKLAKADIVPKATNLRPGYATFSEVESACAEFMTVVNQRVHAVTRRVPADQLLAERERLHAVPTSAMDMVVGEVRSVPENTAMVAYRHGQYSVPADLLGQRVRVRCQGAGGQEQVVISAHDGRAWVEVARHGLAQPGSPSIIDAHFPCHDEAKTPGEYKVSPRSESEREFCRIGEGARLWLTEAARQGACRITTTMADAVTLARVHGHELLDRALGQAAMYGRFAPSDVASITAALAQAPPQAYTASEGDSLAQGTNPWQGHTTT